jgi:hypothetical protein
MTHNHISLLVASILLIVICSAHITIAREQSQSIINNTIKSDTVSKLIEKYGASQKIRIEKGVNQAAFFWTADDGTPEEFGQFCMDNYLADEKLLNDTFARIELNFEVIFGFYSQIGRELMKPLHLDVGPNLPVDYMFAEFSPDAHLFDDLFQTKVAFTVLLNFPSYTLEEKIALAPQWSRLDWAKARLADLFISRIPYEAQQKAVSAYVKAEDYISNYNIFLHNVSMNGKDNLFPEGLKVISHWGLRDELKAHYANPDELLQQEAILSVMEHIIKQDIPRCVINNEKMLWDVTADKAFAPDTQKEISCEPENDIRYKHLIAIFKAEKNFDQYYPTIPNFIDRKFKRSREIPEDQVKTLFESILKSPVTKDIGKIIEKRLKRKLRPFDIWYSGFKSQAEYTEAELDKITQEKYPNVEAFQNDIPNILMKLGFDKEKALFISSKIVVDPARGSGHAMGARMKDDKAHLRTRIGAKGMNYKGYNIAIHELGHNVEQVISLNMVDHYLLSGVPNTAFTEAYAMTFQSRDLELLGLKKTAQEDKYWEALNSLWATYEIAGVSMVDIEVWHWLYNHPEATEHELKNAVITIAKNIWNTYYAPIFTIKDQDILAIYSHMIDSGLYLPDYPLGHIIAFQIEQYIEQKGDLAGSMIKQCQSGSIIPDQWMKTAVGESISTAPMIQAAEEALVKLKFKKK